MEAKIRYMESDAEFSLPVFGIVSEANMLYDEDRQGGRGLNKGIVFLKYVMFHVGNYPRRLRVRSVRNRLQSTHYS